MIADAISQGRSGDPTAQVQSASCWLAWARTKLPHTPARANREALLEMLARAYARSGSAVIEVASPFVQMETGMSHTWAVTEPKKLAQWGVVKVISDGDFRRRRPITVELIMPEEWPAQMLLNAPVRIPKKDYFWMNNVGLSWDARAVYNALPGTRDQVRGDTGFNLDPARFDDVVAVLLRQHLISVVDHSLSILREVSSEERAAARRRYLCWRKTVWLPKAKSRHRPGSRAHGSRKGA